MVERSVVLNAGALVLSAALGALAPGAAIAHPTTLREALFGNRQSDGRKAAAPPIARYETAEGASFVLDQSSGTPLLKFEGSSEVWVLRAAPAPRGDIIFRNDLGQPVLRATRLGGLTLFAPNRPGGTPAAMAGAAGSLRLQATSAQALLRRMAAASLQVSRAAGRLIPFDARDVTPGSEAIYADAAGVTAVALIQLTQRKNGKRTLSYLKRVEFRPGGRAEAVRAQDTLRITVNPQHGLAGRPSSVRVSTAAMSK
jgi:hypothetical protein